MVFYSWAIKMMHDPINIRLESIRLLVAADYAQGSAPSPRPFVLSFATCPNKEVIIADLCPLCV